MSRYGILTAFVFSALLVILNIKSCNDSTTVLPGTSIVVIHDTVLKVIPETTYVYRKGATVHTIDTVPVVVTHPFIAINDTSIGKVAILDTFFFPEKTFSTRITRKADSIQIVERTLYKVDTLLQREPASTWEQTALTALGTIVGVLIGRATK